MDAGALLGDLWMEGYFGAGDPLTRRWNVNSKKRNNPSLPVSHIEFLVEETFHGSILHRLFYQESCRKIALFKFMLIRGRLHCCETSEIG